jgi:hypothetical protein
MDFKNLECNILYLLVLESRQLNTKKPLDVRQLYKKFGDIPAENLNKAIVNLNNSGLLYVPESSRDLFLTWKGVSKVKEISNCLKEKSIYAQHSAMGCCLKDS